MSKGAATESDLAKLHAIISKVLAAQLGETIVTNQDEVEADPTIEEVRMYLASPALITVAARFVKDNDVTAAVEEQADGTAAVKARLARLKANRHKVVPLRELTPVDENHG